MPLGRDVGENLKELRRAHPEWTEERRMAAALSGARAAGADIKPPPGERRKRKRSRRPRRARARREHGSAAFSKREIRQGYRVVRPGRR